MGNLAHLDDLYDLFYVAAYGANQRCLEEIDSIFYKSKDAPKVALYQFFEYFLSTPFPKKSSNPNYSNAYLLAPFAGRMIENNMICPKLDDKKTNQLIKYLKTYNENKEPNKIQKLNDLITDSIQFDFRTDEMLKDIKLAFNANYLLFTNMAIERWKGNYGNIDGGVNSPSLTWSKIFDENNNEYSIGKITKWRPNWQFFDNIQRLSSADYKTISSSLILSGFFKEIFSNKFIDEITGIFLPIASSNYFYGTIWIMLPNSKSEDKLLNTISLRLSKLIDRHYLPALTMLHEHWIETRLEEIDKPKEDLSSFQIKLNESESFIYPNFLLEYSPESGANTRNLITKTDLIKSELHKLWEYRTDLTKEKYKESLIFKKFLIVSESMTECLHQVIKSTRTMKKRNDNLPACLIIGSAGAGKEKLAKLVKLFTYDYRQGDEFVINLASIRPAPLTSAIMVGSEIGEGKKFEIVGILSKMFKSESCSSLKPTLILDEFNSMDPDSQGILLRFLDNSEIIPIGSVDSKVFKYGLMRKDIEINCLIIGMMNEDPDDISREDAVDFLKNNKYLGRVFSDLFYEHFIKIRRLRPDIKYRMIRNGRFTIPSLKDRIEDIPLMFYIFVRDELKEIIKTLPGEESKYSSSVHVTLPVLNRLSQKDLQWRGNVRQLQALTKIVSQNVWQYQESSAIDPIAKQFSFNIYFSDLIQSLSELDLIELRNN